MAEEDKVANLIKHLECLVRTASAEEEEWTSPLGCVMDVLRCVYDIGHERINSKRMERIGALLLPALMWLKYFAWQQQMLCVTQKTLEKALIYREALGLLVNPHSQYRVTKVVDNAITEELERTVDWVMYDNRFKTYEWVMHRASFSRLFPPHVPPNDLLPLEQDMKDLLLK